MDEIKKDVEEVKSDLEEVSEKVDTVSEDVKTILMLLTGTKYDESQGLINRFEKETMDNEIKFDKLEKRLDSLEKLKDRVLYIGIGVGMSLGGSLAGLVYAVFGKK